MSAKRKFYVRRDTVPFAKQEITDSDDNDPEITGFNSFSDSIGRLANREQMSPNRQNGGQEVARETSESATPRDANPGGEQNSAEEQTPVNEQTPEGNGNPAEEANPAAENNQEPRSTDENGGEVPETDRTESEDNTDEENDAASDDENDDAERTNDDNESPRETSPQGTTTTEAGNITPESVERARQGLFAPIILDEFENYSPTGTSRDKDIMAKWRKYAVRDAAASGLRLGVDLMSHTLGAMGSLVKLANGFIKNPFSDPTGAARSLVNGVVEAGALAQGVVDSIGMVWGIKDGVKQEDVAGTYRGAKYYKEHRDAERVQAKFNEDIGRLTKDIYGEDKNPEDLADLLKNDIAEATNEDSDIISRKKAQNRIISWMKNLETMGNTPEGKRLLDMVKRQKMEATNDAIPKGKKYIAPVEAQMYYNLYTTFSNAIINVNRDIGAISARQANQHRHNLQDLGENRRSTRRSERQDAIDARAAERDAAEDEYNRWLETLQGGSREFAEVFDGIGLRLNANAGVYNGTGEGVGTGLPYVNRSTALKAIKKLEDLSRKDNGLTDAQKRVLDILNAREHPPKGVAFGNWAQDRIDRILQEKTGANRWGVSNNLDYNKTIVQLAEENMYALENKGEKNTPEYRKWEKYYTMGQMSIDLARGRRNLRKERELLDEYLANNSGTIIGSNGENLETVDDILEDYESMMDEVYDRLSDPKPLDEDTIDDQDWYEGNKRNLRGMKKFIDYLIREAKKAKK